MNLLKPILDPDGSIPDRVFHNYLRKAAHMAEYMALGACVSGFFTAGGKRTTARLAAALACCAAVAAVDECIQIFSDGRGPQVRDVLIDICGALCGIAVVTFVSYIAGRAHRRRSGL